MMNRNILIYFLFAFGSLHAQEDVINQLCLEFIPVGNSWCNDWNDYRQERNEELLSNIYGELILSNNSDTSATFWMMSCGWTDQTAVLPSTLYFGVAECDANAPKKITLNSNQILKLNSIIMVPTDQYKESVFRSHLTNPPDSVFDSFKIGFLMINEHDFSYQRHRYDDWIKINDSLKNISKYIWTDEISLRYYNYDWRIE